MSETNYETAMRVYRRAMLDWVKSDAYSEPGAMSAVDVALKAALESIGVNLGQHPTYLCAKCGTLLKADPTGAFFNTSNYRRECPEGGAHYAKPYDEAKVIEKVREAERIYGG